MSVYHSEKLSIEEHNEFVLNSNYGVYYQSSYFAKEKEVLGYEKTIYVDLVDEKRNVCGCNSMSIKKIPKVNGYYGYSRMGFVLDYDAPDWKERLSVLWTETVKAAKANNVVYFKFDLPLNVPEERSDVVDFFKELGAAHKGFFDNNAPYTYFRFRSTLDISKTLDEILAGIPRKTRWMLNRAMKYAFVVEKNCINDIDIYYKLKQETAVRNNIETLSYEEDKTIIENAKKSGGYTLSLKLDLDKTLAFCEQDLAKWKKKLDKEMSKSDDKQNKNLINDINSSIEKLSNQISELQSYKEDSPEGVYLSSCVVLIYGNEVEYYKAASSSILREYYPNYLMLWKVIEDAKDRGYKLLDLGGTYPDSEKSGLGHFKRNWGAVTVGYSGDFEYVVGGLIGVVFKYLMKAKEMRR